MTMWIVQPTFLSNSSDTSAFFCDGTREYCVTIHPEGKLTRNVPDVHQDCYSNWEYGQQMVESTGWVLVGETTGRLVSRFIVFFR